MRSLFLSLLALALLCPGPALVSGQSPLEKQEQEREKQLALLKKMGADVLIRKSGLFIKSINIIFQGPRFSDRTLAAAMGPLLKLQADNPLGVNISESALTDAGLERIKALKDLRWLDVHGTRITDKGLQALKGLNKLEYLDINRTRVTDKGLEHLFEMKTLKTVVLFESKVTEKGKTKLKEALPGISFDPE